MAVCIVTTFIVSNRSQTHPTPSSWGLSIKVCCSLQWIYLTFSLTILCSSVHKNIYSIYCRTFINSIIAQQNAYYNEERDRASPCYVQLPLLSWSLNDQLASTFNSYMLIVESSDVRQPINFQDGDILLSKHWCLFWFDYLATCLCRIVCIWCCVGNMKTGELQLLPTCK